MLSARDREVLDQIQHDLLAEDPGFVQHLTANRAVSPSHRDLDRYTYTTWIFLVVALVLSLLSLSMSAFIGAALLAAAVAFVAVKRRFGGADGADKDQNSRYGERS